MGLMQLMPALAEEMGVTDPFDPRDNIMGGAKYLRQLLDAHEGNIRLTLASYNAGPGNVETLPGHPAVQRNAQLRAQDHGAAGNIGLATVG